MNRRLFDFYASMYWAIMPKNLQEMYDIYQAAVERKGIGIDFDPEAVAAKIGRPLDNTRKVETRDDGVAVIPILGPIFPRANIFTQISNATSIDVLATDFNTALEDRSIHSIVFNVNTPGGAVDGVSEFAGMVFNARGIKPIVGYSGNLAASAGLWILSAMGEVVVGDTASLGSIGVIGGVEISEDKKIKYFVSDQSPNKRPNPLTESGKAQFQSHVNVLASVFIQTVARNRNMSFEDVIEKGDKGGLKVGQHAVDAGFADRLGTLEGVIADLSNSNSKKFNTRATLQTESFKGVESMADKQPDKTVIEDKDKKPAAEAQPPKQDAKVEDKSAELATAQVENEKLKAELAKAQTANAKQDAELSEVRASVAELQKQARTSRFMDLSKGWPGATADNLAMLEHLATTKGEDSDLFKAHVTSMNAAKAQIEAGNLLKEIGSNAPVEGSASAEIDAKAKKRADESAGKETYQQAYDAIYAADSALRGRVDADQRRSVN